MMIYQIVGNVIQVIKYSITLDDVTKYGITEGEANAVAKVMGDGAIVTRINSEYGWMDGAIIRNTTDPAMEAARIYEMGEAAYKAQLALVEKSKNEQLRADLDYVMLMGGL